jgi:protein-L-isoaspartate(D-aspartate) O-methyltransferase
MARASRTVKPAHQGIGMTSLRTRKRLVRRIEAEGISDPAVLNAIAEVPRHIFVDEALASRAYEDTALPIGHNQTISQPFVVARMTELLLGQRQPPRTVLEIGTGSGYQTAVLAKLVEEVYTVERIEVLLRQAMNRLYDIRVRNVQFLCADGFAGWPEHAPYDGIVVTAAPAEIPAAYLEQLAIGGRLVIPVGEPSQQRLVTVTRNADDYVREDHDRVRFVPLTAGRI